MAQKQNDYRWPQKGDRPLRSGDRLLRGKDGMSVGFSEHPDARQVQIWSGYMKAGEMLIRACEERRLKPHELIYPHDLIYPILFCYRHGLEIALKWIVETYGGAADVSLPDSSHDLWQLWKSCKAVIAFSGEEDAITPIVEQIIKDFHDIDSGEVAFRYSTDKKGVVYSLPDTPIDLSNLRDVMKGVNHFFDGVDAYLDHLSEYEGKY
jgi:hypothetical protein